MKHVDHSLVAGADINRNSCRIPAEFPMEGSRSVPLPAVAVTEKHYAERESFSR
jgi:hypothetical protein